MDERAGHEAGRKYRTLVVDDDESWRFLVRRLLKRTGTFEVVGEAADGAEAIAEAERAQPDLVLLDLRMPGMPGEAALPEILKRAPAARVVIVSGMDASTTAPPLLAKGAAGYIEKGGPPGSLERELLAIVGPNAVEAQA